MCRAAVIQRTFSSSSNLARVTSWTRRWTESARSPGPPDDGRKLAIDGVLHRVEDVIGVHVNQRRVAGHRAGPFEIEVRFIDIAVDDSRVARSGDEQDLRVVRRQPVFSPKLLQIGELDARLPGNDDALSGPVD